MKLKIILFIFALSFLIYPAYSQETSPLLTVNVSNDIFEGGDTIVISGNVATIIEGRPVTISIFHEGPASSSLIEIAQLEIAGDGTFTDSILAEGPQWNSEGKYVVRAQYGEGNIADTSFEFFPKQVTDTSDNFEVDAGNFGTFDVPYTIRGGIVNDMVVDTQIFAIIVIIESTSDGNITVDLPREFIDAKKMDESDDTFIILIDGIEVPYQESQTSETSRVITIEFEEGDSDIEIIGTFVIPEFGAIASLVLAISIISIILISKKNFVKI